MMSYLFYITVFFPVLCVCCMPEFKYGGMCVDSILHVYGDCLCTSVCVRMVV